MKISQTIRITAELHETMKVRLALARLQSAKLFVFHSEPSALSGRVDFVVESSSMDVSQLKEALR